MYLLGNCPINCAGKCQTRREESAVGTDFKVGRCGDDDVIREESAVDGIDLLGSRQALCRSKATHCRMRKADCRGRAATRDCKILVTTVSPARAGHGDRTGSSSNRNGGGDGCSSRDAGCGCYPVELHGRGSSKIVTVDGNSGTNRTRARAKSRDHSRLIRSAACINHIFQIGRYHRTDA